MSSKARVTGTVPLGVKAPAFSFQPKLPVEWLAVLACGWLLLRVLNLGLFWLGAVALTFPLAWAAAALQQRFVLGGTSRVLSAGERLAWWLGTALYAFTLAEPAGAVAIDRLRIALRATVAENLVDGAGSLVMVGVFLTVGLLSWNVRHVLDLKQIAGGVSSVGVSVISWLLLLFPAATLVQMSLRPQGMPDPGRTLALLACIALTCAIAIWRMIWFRPRSSDGVALVVLIPESTIPASVVSLINSFAARWARGPVTVIARPAEAARLSGRFAHLAAASGALPALIPRSLPELSDSQAFLAPAEEWRSIPVREIYPTPGLWPETVRRFTSASARVLVVTTGPRKPGRKFGDLPGPAAELLGSVRRALPVGQPLYQLSPNAARSPTGSVFRRTLFSTATRVFVGIVRSTLDISVTQSPARGSRTVFVVYAANDQRWAESLAKELNGAKDARGFRMSVKMLPHSRERLSFSERLLQATREAFSVSDPIMAMAIRRLWLNPRFEGVLRYLAPQSDPRLGIEMDVLVIASDSLPRGPDPRLWRTLANNAKAGVFSRAIVAFPERRQWNGTLLPCDFELDRPAAALSEVDVIADWKRRLLANELSPVGVAPPAADQTPTSTQTPLPTPTPTQTQAPNPTSTPTPTPTPTLDSSPSDSSPPATQTVCAIRSVQGALLGTGVLITVPGASAKAPREPVVLTTVALDGVDPDSLVFDFPLLNLTCGATSILSYQQPDLGSPGAGLYRFGVIHLKPPLPQMPDLAVAAFNSLTTDPRITLVGYSPELPRGLSILQAHASLQRRDTTPDLLAYTIPGLPLTFGGALFDRQWRLVGLQCAAVATPQHSDADRVREVSLALPIQFILGALTRDR